MRPSLEEQITSYQREILGNEGRIQTYEVPIGRRFVKIALHMQRLRAELAPRLVAECWDEDSKTVSGSEMNFINFTLKNLRVGFLEEPREDAGRKIRRTLHAEILDDRALAYYNREEKYIGIYPARIAKLAERISEQSPVPMNDEAMLRLFHVLLDQFLSHEEEHALQDFRGDEDDVKNRISYRRYNLWGQIVEKASRVGFAAGMAEVVREGVFTHDSTSSLLTTAALTSSTVFGLIVSKIVENKGIMMYYDSREEQEARAAEKEKNFGISPFTVTFVD